MPARYEQFRYYFVRRKSFSLSVWVYPEPLTMWSATSSSFSTSFFKYLACITLRCYRLLLILLLLLLLLPKVPIIVGYRLLPRPIDRINSLPLPLPKLPLFHLRQHIRIACSHLLLREFDDVGGLFEGGFAGRVEIFHEVLVTLEIQLLRIT